MVVGGVHTVGLIFQYVLHLFHCHLQHLCVLHLGINLLKQRRCIRNTAYLCKQVMRRMRVLLTSVSASKFRSSRKLSLMRARLFFSTSGFRICKIHIITVRNQKKMSLPLLISTISSSLPRAWQPHRRCTFLSVFWSPKSNSSPSVSSSVWFDRAEGAMLVVCSFNRCCVFPQWGGSSWQTELVSGRTKQIDKLTAEARRPVFIVQS